MGVGTLRTLDRLAAAVGALDAAPLEFESVDDVPMGGVLCALPALLTLGLLRHTRDTFWLLAIWNGLNWERRREV